MIFGMGYNKGMSKINIYRLVGVVAALVILVLIFGLQKSDTELDKILSPYTNSNEEQIQGNQDSPQDTKKSIPSAIPKVQSQSITFLSPVAGTQWVINQNNIIKWNREPGVTGGIYLVDAITGTLVGWITPTITSHQKEYTWDTRDVLLNRQGGLKKSVAVGRYILKIKFDRNQADAQSGEFSIVYASQIEPVIYKATIKNLIFAPSSLIINKGEKIIVQNDDTVSHKIIGYGIGSSVTLAPGASMTVETNVLGIGEYEYYSESYASAKLKVTVK